MRLFLDTNILIDIIEDRVEFAEDSTAVLIFITRNVRDFGSSPVPAISPKDFVVRFASP
jgi:hypothetical protein